MNMTPDTIEQDPPGESVLAGEFVLGVLEPQAHAAARARVEQDPAFAADVQRWEQHLAPLVEQVAPIEVPDYLWIRIGSALGLLQPAPGRGGHATASSPRTGFWNNLGLWRGVGIGGLATAMVAVLALVSLLRQAPPTATPPVAQQAPTPPAHPIPQMVASLASDDGQTGYVATMDTRSGRMTVMPMHPAREPGRVPELWIIPKGGKAISMGLLDPDHPQQHTLPARLRDLLSTDALLAVTMEPPGGAPGGVATGAVVAKGGITALALSP